MPQIFKEEDLLTAVIIKSNTTTNQTAITVNTTASTGNSSSVAKLTTSVTCSVPVYNSSGKSAQDHVVDFITGQVGHFATWLYHHKVL